MDIKRSGYVASRCRCCGRRIKSDYSFCIGCERKRMKILNACIGVGMSYIDAMAKVNSIYPENYL